MERQGFDDLTRSVALGTSRRGALKALAGGAAGGLAALLGGTSIGTAANQGNGKGNQGNGNGNGNGNQGNGNGKGKGGGKIKPECCPADRPLLCGGHTCLECCADDHCPAGQTCAAGACVDPHPTCNDGVRNGSETDVDCGGGCPGCGLGAACVVGADCASGVCRDNVCVAGVCRPGETRPCGSNVGICEFGTETCAEDGSGWGPCLGGVGPRPETCNNLDDDCDGIVDAGGCPPMHNAIYGCGETADGVRCVLVACDSGFGDCDGDPTNGCETDITTSLTHCGACGRACRTDPNGTTTCENGTCFITCNPGFVLSGDRCVLVAVVGVGVTPATFPLGAIATGTVHLNAPAPVNTTVSLTIDQPAAANVPPGAIVPAGQLSTSFPVQGARASDGPVRLTARLGASQVSTTFTVLSSV